MQDGSVEIAGIIIHSRDPVFLTVVGFHILAGLSAVTAGLVAMLSAKRAGHHPHWGRRYFWAICAVFATAVVLAIMRGPEDFHLVVLGACALAGAWIGRSARQGGFGNSLRVHLTGMGLSYIFLLTAFYVETGDQLPVWRDLPPLLYWIMPAAVGLPMIAHALIWHPRIRRKSA
jgi:hypothetical protein